MIPIELGVSKLAHMAAAAEIVAKESDSLTYLVNNAGRNHFMPILDEDIEQCKRVFDTNVWGPLAITKVFASLVIKAKGCIVNVTSISGYVNTP